MIEAIQPLNVTTESNMVLVSAVLAPQVGVEDELNASLSTLEEMREVLHQARMGGMAQVEKKLLEEKIAQSVYFLSHGGYRDIPNGLEKLIDGLNFVGITNPIRNKYIFKWLFSAVSKDKKVAQVEFSYATEAMKKSLEVRENVQKNATELGELKAELISSQIHQLGENIFMLIDGSGNELAHFFTFLQNYDLQVGSVELYEQLLKQRDQFEALSDGEFEDLVLKKLDMAKALLAEGGLKTDVISRLRRYFFRRYMLDSIVNGSSRRAQN